MTPRCPRCGYDMRGATAAWNDGCDLEGRCTECGLEFEWRRVFSPDAFPPEWNIEYCPQPRLPWAFLCTFAAAITAWPLWRRISMEMPWRPKRLLLFVAALLLLSGLTPLAGNAAVAIDFWWSHREARGLSWVITDPNLPARTFPAGAKRGPQLITLLVEAIFLPLESTSRATVVLDGRELPCPSPRARTLSMISLEELARSPQAVVSWSPMRGGIGGGQDRFLLLGVPSNPIAAQRVLRSAGVVAPVPPTVARYVRHLLTRHAVPLLAAMAIQFATMPLFFLLLPQTRGMCRVRREHIARVALYCAAPACVLLVGVLPLRAYLITFGIADHWAEGEICRALSLGMPALLALFWAIAISKYLRIRGAVGVALLAALLGWLLTAVSLPRVILLPLFTSDLWTWT